MHAHTLTVLCLPLSDAPEISSAGVITVAEGGTAVTLEFTIDANPSPTVPNTISTSSGSSDVPSSLSVDGNSVVVSGDVVSRSDSGQYLFISENTVSSSSVEFMLDVQCKCVLNPSILESQLHRQQQSKSLFIILTAMACG